MAIVIDTNTFAMVFDQSNAKHMEFSPVKAWIERGMGFLLFGGTKYLKELSTSYRHMRLVRQLRDAGMAIEISTPVVDGMETTIIKATAGTICNDQHVMALLAAAHCSLVCSEDSKSFEFIKNRSLYPKGSPKVRIYSSAKNVRLLSRCCREEIRNCIR